MDNADFFDYPNSPHPHAEPAAPFLDDADEREWDALLSYMEIQHLYPGETLFSEGERDRALFLLTAGRLEVHSANDLPSELEGPSTLNEIAFLDDGICLVTARAMTDSEVLRLGFDAFEALAIREPVIARKVLLDLGRILARALKSAAR